MSAIHRFCRSWVIASLGMVVVFSEAQEFKTDKIPEDLLSLPKQLANMPDCRFEYWSEFGASKRRQRHCYLKKGACWRVDIFDEQKSLVRTVSFDGENYYVFEPKSVYLLVTPYADMVSNDAEHTSNPLCCWAGVFFYTMHKTFGIAEWSNAALFAEQLSKHSITSLKCESPQQRRYKLENEKFEFEILLEKGDFGFMQVLEFVRRDKYKGKPSDFDMVFIVRFDDWVSIPAKDSAIVLPMKITPDSRHMDGTPLGDGSTSCQVIEGTVAPVFDDEVIATEFRVPLNSVPQPYVVTKRS